MKRFMILGAGRQGSACAAFLLEQFDATAIDFVDSHSDHLASAMALQRDASRVTCHQFDVSPVGEELARLMASAVCIVSCVPYSLNVTLTEAAIAANTPFCDLGGNVGTVAAQLAKADACKRAGIAIAPDCGLAPGLLNILAEYWAGDWEYQSAKLYCGGLPKKPSGVFKYALTFNICGLLNEYLDDCQVSRGGRVETVAGMSDVEHLTDLALSGEFEAFATSGGASLGARLYAEQGIDYQYKTIRYLGHRDIICAMREMGFFDTKPREFPFDGQNATGIPRQISAEIMEKNLQSDGQDLVVARADVVATKDGQRKTGRIDLLDYADDRFTAMERTTGFPTAIVAAALAGLYERRIEPGAYVPFQIIDPKLAVEELARAGVSGIAICET